MRSSPPLTSVAYRALVTVVDRVLPLIARAGPSKLSVGDRERRLAIARWERWGREHRNPQVPLLWCHAPSVGEGLQAEAVLRVLRERHPEWQIAYSFYSPSAAELAARQPADVADYLPYDTRANVERLLRALRPTALIFTKLDLWPELATRAAADGVAVGMIAATVSPVSGRLKEPARRLTRAGYATLDRAGAIAEADAVRLTSLGVPRERITITGDPRFDSAYRRAAAAYHDVVVGNGDGALVAGSTWPRDERILLAAFARIRRERPGARIVVVPHEPTEAHLERLETEAAHHGLTPIRSSRNGAGELLIVDVVGVLAGLYRGAAMAYVGGGFGSAGLHSVLEPAACGIPMLFGPRWQSSREAGLLLDAGAAVSLPDAEAEAVAQLARVWTGWLDHSAERAALGDRALAVVKGELGADRRNADLIEALVASRAPVRSASRR